MPSQDWKALTATLGRLFETLTPTDIIIWDRPDARRPDVPYITLNYITGPVRVAQHDEERVEDDGSITMCAQRMFTLGIKSYIGEVDSRSHPEFWRPFQALSDLSILLTATATRETFRKEGLAIFNVTDVIDITELLETGFEPRASLDVLFSYTENIDAGVGVGVDEVVVTQEDITDNTGTTDEEFTITTP